MEKNYFPCIAIIVAIASNNVIGCNNQIPWHLPEDLVFFKKNTIGKPIVMGRKTLESLPSLLRYRPHIVITSNLHYIANKKVVIVTHSLEEAIIAASVCKNNVKEIMIIGGANLYRQALKIADRIYLTEINIHPYGDTFFPMIDKFIWQPVTSQKYTGYTFTILERKRT